MNAASKRVAGHVLAVVVLIGTADCGGGSDSPVTPPVPPKPTPVLTTLNMSASAVTLVAKQTAQLSVTTLDQSAQPIAATVTWTSGAAAVATVSSTGLVTAVAPGTATVSASATAGTVTLTGTTAVTVTPAAGVTSVAVTPATLSLVVGATGTLSAAVVADPGVATAVTWTSANATSASVSSAGVVTALAAGTSQVCATSTFDTSKQGCASVTVSAVPVATVAVTPASSSVFVGQTVQLSAATSDANGNALTGRAVAWATNSASIATVSSTGSVSAVGAGTATITATSEGKSGSATIVVSSPSVASVVVTPSSSSISVSQNVQLSANVSGSGNPPRGVSWASADATKVTVNQSGLATGVAAGSTQVCATSSFDPSKSGCATIAVSAPTFPSSATISAPGIGFNPTQVDIALGGTVTYSFASITHNVTFNATPGAPANVGNTSNADVNRQFNTAGTFNFDCTLHAGMTGTVVVH